jgi:hypothetical protein
VRDRDEPCDGVRVSVPDIDGVRDDVRLIDGVRDDVPLVVGDTDDVAVDDGDAPVENDGVPEPVCVTETVGDRDCDGVPDLLGVVLGELPREGVCVRDAVSDGLQGSGGHRGKAERGVSVRHLVAAQPVAITHVFDPVVDRDMDDVAVTDLVAD